MNKSRKANRSEPPVFFVKAALTNAKKWCNVLYMHSYRGGFYMEENKEIVAQNKPKLDITQLDNTGIYELNYSGSAMIMTKDELGKLFKRLQLKDKKIANLTEKNQVIISDLDSAKKEINDLKSELTVAKGNVEKLKCRLETFTKYQGNGRPPVLSEEHKRTIQALYGQKMTVADIHKTLILNFGFKGNYETIRKYVRDSESAKAWQ